MFIAYFSGKNIVRLAQKVKERSDSMRIAPVFVLCLTIACGIFEGCSSKKEYTPDKNFVRIYSELAVMYEKEKMTDKISDSTYRVSVNNFFASHKLTEQQFEEKVNQLMTDGTQWRRFLTDVSATIDEIKREKR